MLTDRSVVERTVRFAAIWIRKPGSEAPKIDTTMKVIDRVDRGKVRLLDTYLVGWA